MVFGERSELALELDFNGGGGGTAAFSRLKMYFLTFSDVLILSAVCDFSLALDAGLVFPGVPEVGGLYLGSSLAPEGRCLARLIERESKKTHVFWQATRKVGERQFEKSSRVRK